MLARYIIQKYVVNAFSVGFLLSKLLKKHNVKRTRWSDMAHRDFAPSFQIYFQPVSLLRVFRNTFIPNCERIFGVITFWGVGHWHFWFFLIPHFCFQIIVQVQFLFSPYSIQQNSSFFPFASSYTSEMGRTCFFVFMLRFFPLNPPLFPTFIPIIFLL